MINLNSANLYVLWGVRVDDSQPGMLLTHGANVPAASRLDGSVLDTPVSYSSYCIWANLAGAGGGGGRASEC